MKTKILATFALLLVTTTAFALPQFQYQKDAGWQATITCHGVTGGSISGYGQTRGGALDDAIGACKAIGGRPDPNNRIMWTPPKGYSDARASTDGRAPASAK